ncbi:MAG: hypothetical protein WKF42_09240, partial [Solirubrobacteraceae bacterium]
VLVLVEEAHTPDELDVAELREKLRKAEDDYAAADAHSEAQKRAGRDRRRWTAFLRIAEGGAAG